MISGAAIFKPVALQRAWVVILGSRNAWQNLSNSAFGIQTGRTPGWQGSRHLVSENRCKWKKFAFERDMDIVKLFPSIALVLIVCPISCGEQLDGSYELQNRMACFLPTSSSKVKRFVFSWAPYNVICQSYEKMDLRPLKEAFGHRIDGVLGLPFFANRTLTFSASASFIEASKKPGYSRVEGLRRLEISVGDFGLLYCSTESLGLPFKADTPLLIDSGNYQMLNVDEQTFARIAMLDGCIVRASDSASMVAAASGNSVERANSRVAVLPLKVLALRLEVFETSDCMAGLPLLEALNIQIDFTNNVCWAKSDKYPKTLNGFSLNRLHKPPA